VRIAVCNRYWATAGGGETYALAIARALASVGDVDLVGPAGVDWRHVGDRLQANLSQFDHRSADFDDARALSRLSADYDLFVNTTFGTDLACLARRSLLVVHFPSRPKRGSVSLRARLRRAAVGARAQIEWAGGFYGPEGSGQPFRWTDGDGVVALSLAPGRKASVEIAFGPDCPRSTEVAVVHDDRMIASGKVGPDVADPRVSFTVTSHETNRPTVLRIQSGAFRPRDVLGTPDDRALGVQVVDVRVDGRRPAPASPGPAPRSRWLDSYDRVVVNSEYTRHWVRQWWRRDAAVLYPAVAPRRRGRKAPVILAVGRFFAPERGHSKRQLEMVDAFQRLNQAGLRGWELHLVGGCQREDRPYLEHVRHAARGLPIRFHVDAAGPALNELYEQASLFWQATGLHESPRSAPEQHEHFGIAVVEAMSAGVVPVVYHVGGPAETVRDGIEGLHFSSVEGLVQSTGALMDDAGRRHRMAAASQARAERFSPDALAARLREIVATLPSGPAPVTSAAGGTPSG
jgi:glycosyltransferase involved in cell wall biosynthesis